MCCVSSVSSITHPVVHLLSALKLPSLLQLKETVCKSSGWIHIVLGRSEKSVQLINNAALFLLSVLFGRRPNKMHLSRDCKH